MRKTGVFFPPHVANFRPIPTRPTFLSLEFPPGFIDTKFDAEFARFRVANTSGRQLFCVISKLQWWYRLRSRAKLLIVGPRAHLGGHVGQRTRVQTQCQRNNTQHTKYNTTIRHSNKHTKHNQYCTLTAAATPAWGLRPQTPMARTTLRSVLF